ncbi:MAG: nucleoside deaminase [Magnetococcales bacterium]|nr:nucleoside deaminase [Magnetococcales bacterium]
MTVPTPFLSKEQSLAVLALAGAVGSGAQDEVPVGAVLVDEWGRILAQTGNRPIAAHNPHGHAEIIAMGVACQRIANYRLVNTSLTVSLEPCPLCCEALKMARVSRVSSLASRSENHSSVAEKRSFVVEENLEVAELLKYVSGQLLRFFFARRRGICLNPSLAKN